MYVACPNCGVANGVANRYCTYCGASVGDKSALVSTLQALLFAPAEHSSASAAVARTRSAFHNIRATLDFPDNVPYLPLDRKARILVEIGLVAALTLVALLIRVWDLGTLPAGPAGDESTVALETIRILNGEWIGIWSGVTLGNPTGHMYWIAPFFGLGGPTLTMLRLSSALLGVALIPVCYLMVRMLFPMSVAFVSASLLTFFYWFVIIYRIGIPITMSVFVAAASLCLVVYAVRSSRLWVAGVAGVMLGAGLYVFKGYTIYFVAIWGATLLAMLVSSRLRRNWVLFVFLGASLVAGAVMIEFYATTNYLSQNLHSQYQVSGSDLLSLPAHLRRVAEVVMFVHVPPEFGAFGFDGIIPKPLLHPAIAVFFWVGLVTTLLFIDRRPFQLLLLGWLIGMAPAILVPGGETRRYLLGVFFVLVITAIGFTIVFNLITNRLLTREGGPHWARLNIPRRWANYLLFTVAALAFIGFFAAQNLDAFSDWSEGRETRFQFDHEIAQAARFMGTLDDSYAIRFYSIRWSVNYETVRWFAPGATGVDGSVEFGGDGTIFSDGVVAQPSLFMLLGGYHRLVDDLESTYPDGTAHTVLDEDGSPLFIAYTIDTPPPPGSVQVPAYRRLTPNPSETTLRVGDSAAFRLVTNQKDRTRVVANPSESDSANFALQDESCPGSVESSALLSNGELLYVTACSPGSGQLWLYPADGGATVAKFLVGASDHAGGPPDNTLNPSARILPDPAELTVSAAPNEHHPLHLVSTRSVLIIPSPADAVVIHNNPDLQYRDGCEEVQKRPEGDTRLSVILNGEGVETRSLFYLVGCAPGQATLDVVAGDVTLASYTFFVQPP